MPKTLDELEVWARFLRKENHPLAETMEEISEGWRKEREHLRDALAFYATDKHPRAWLAIHALQFSGTDRYIFQESAKESRNE